MKGVDSPQSLRMTLATLPADPVAAAAMGGRAREVVRREQGATARHVELILKYLPAGQDRSTVRKRHDSAGQ